jgi:hypothetical protein
MELIQRYWSGLNNLMLIGRQSVNSVCLSTCRHAEPCPTAPSLNTPRLDSPYHTLPNAICSSLQAIGATTLEYGALRD